ncbi:MAG: CDP-2,3-bis-(O-geranylgeranyl)-sn-glycerol synthase [Nanoarchaeota archaeon]
MLIFILQSLYYFLPAYFANMSPVLFRKVFHSLALPVDMGRSLKGKRILGDNKTWRGIVIGTAMAMLIAVLQKALYQDQFFQGISLIDYSSISYFHILLLGFLLGLGALLGDAVKSFFKRQAGVKPGTSWFPFDQLDFVIGGLLLSFLVFIPSLKAVLIILVFSPILHLIVKFIGYLLHVDNKKI